MASKKNQPEDQTTDPATDPATEAEVKGESKLKGKPRSNAAVEVIDYDDVADDDELAAIAAVRSSKWITLLDKLYEDTAAEDSQVPRNEDGTLKFVRLGSFNNPGGARTQVKSFEAKGLDKTYEFKTVVKGKQSFLWVRVIEVADA